MAKKMQRVAAVGEDARNNLYQALDWIAQAVGSTLGPGGRPFGYDKLGGDMRLTASFSKDGLTVLKSLGFPEDPAWEAVLQYCKQAASHSVLASGDGTTSTIVLANEVAKAVRFVQSQNNGSPQALARQIEAEAERAIQAIRAEAVKTDEAARIVATTSSNHDEELTDVVMDALKYTSAFGTILVEKNPASPIRYRILRQDGYSNCFGYNQNPVLALSVSSLAASSKPIEWQRPKVLIFNGNLIAVNQIEPILKAWNDTLATAPTNLAIVAYEVSDEVANRLLVLNRVAAKHGVAAIVVKPRLSAEINSVLQVMWDLAAFCGIKDKFIVDGGNFKDIGPMYFGSCGKMTITPTQTIFLGRDENHWVEERVRQNQSIIDQARSAFDRQITSIRNAELAEGLVKVEVGGGLLPDLQERADRFDDASKAAQACLSDGALPGCGLSYIRAGNLAEVSDELKTALMAVHCSIVNNYGTEPNFNPHRGEGMYLSKKEVKRGDAATLRVMDACATVSSVIKNGVALGIKIAILGGYSYRDPTADVDDYE